MSADGQYRSLLDTGSVPFSGSRREMGYESRFHGLNQTSAVVFGTQERSLSRSGSGASSLASREFNTLTRRTNQTESTLMPLKSHVTAEERVSLQGRPAYMPRGNVRRMESKHVYGDYDPIRHEWIVPAHKFDVANKVGDLKPTRKKPVALPQAMGDDDPIYEKKWVSPPSGKQHMDREYKPELRTRGRIPSPPIPEGTINIISHKEGAAPDTKKLRLSRKELTGSVNRVTWMGSDLVPAYSAERAKLPPINMNNNSTTLPTHSFHDRAENMSITRPKFYLPNHSGVKVM